MVYLISTPPVAERVSRVHLVSAHSVEVGWCLPLSLSCPTELPLPCPTPLNPPTRLGVLRTRGGWRGRTTVPGGAWDPTSSYSSRRSPTLCRVPTPGASTGEGGTLGGVPGRPKPLSFAAPAPPTQVLFHRSPFGPGHPVRTRGGSSMCPSDIVSTWSSCGPPFRPATALSRLTSPFRSGPPLRPDCELPPCSHRPVLTLCTVLLPSHPLSRVLPTP